MKYITLLFGLLFFSALSADGHLKSEQDVLVSLQQYFEARNSEDYKTVVALESKSGTYGTNSDGSFHKPKQISSVQQWEKSNQGGVTKVFYPKAIQLSEDVVYVRFYAEGMVEAGGKSSDYRTRVTMNWVKEDGKWVVKSQHYSPANYGGVHQTQATDFDD
jgi:ketosteroid isomerase-like protein